jgi:hypothetical protein
LKKHFLNASQLEALEKQRQIVKFKPESQRQEIHADAFKYLKLYKKNGNKGTNQVKAQEHHEEEIDQFYRKNLLCRMKKN